MERASILLAAVAFLGTLANVVVGALAGLGVVGLGLHARLAVATVVLALFAWTVVVLYFAGSGAWVRAEAEARRLAGEVVDEADAIRKAVFPSIRNAVLALVAAYVIGGGADTGAVPDWVHLVLGLAALFFHAVAAYRTIVFVGMTLDLQARIEGRAAPGVPAR